MSYKKCSRCSLNYIKENEILCKVCMEEVGNAIRGNEEEEEYDICPECGEGIVKIGEDMCYQCMVERMKEEVDEEELKKDEWEGFLPKDDDELYQDDNAEDDDLGDLEEIELDEEFDENNELFDEEHND